MCHRVHLPCADRTGFLDYWAMDISTTEKIDVSYVARLARLNLSADEAKVFQAQLDDIVGYVRKVRELDVSGVEPMGHGIPMRNVFRKDEVKPGLPREKVLANAPVERDGQFTVPKILE